MIEAWFPWLSQMQKEEGGPSRRVTISLVVYDSSILAVDTDWVDMQDHRLQT